MTLATDALTSIWRALGGEDDMLDRVGFSGTDPVLPSSFAVGAAAQAAIGAAGLAALAFGRARGAQPGDIHIDMRHAAIECQSERHLLVDGRPPGDLWDDLAGAYPCGDGGTVRLHTNFAHHRSGIVALLGGAGAPPKVKASLAQWQAESFEAEATRRGLCVARMRSFAEWDAHPQADIIARAPLITVTRIGDAPPLEPHADGPALAGIRVLELTRILAGPVCGRALAAHGAEVLRLLGPKVPTIDALDIDTGRGKRSALLDLGHAGDRAQLMGLLRSAHVFLQSYRPGALSRYGLAPDALASRRPGIVVASLSAYGEAGPWGGKRGFDSLVQTATGLNVAEAEAAGGAPPRALPLQLLDHASGYLLAAGVTRALTRQRVEGGSWHVEVSLARTGHWLRSLGRIESGFCAAEAGPDDITDLMESTASPYGRITAVRHAAHAGRSSAWHLPPTPFGHDAAAW